jgi:hypothetical protein
VEQIGIYPSRENYIYHTANEIIEVKEQKFIGVGGYFQWNK